MNKLIEYKDGAIYRGLDASGKSRVSFLEQGGNISWAESTLLREQHEKNVRNAFFLSII